MGFTSIPASYENVGAAVDAQFMTYAKDNFDFLYAGSAGTIGIRNGDFEVDSDADGVPDGWTWTAYPGGNANPSDLTTTINGLRTIKCVHPGGASNGGGELKSEYIPCTGNKKAVSISAVHYATAATMRNKVVFYWFDKSKVALTGGDVSTVVYNSITNPTVATNMFLLAVPPSGARFFKLGLIGGFTDTNVAGTAYFDEVKLIEGGLIKGHISGLILSNDTDADHDIKITAGECAVANNAVVVLGTEITKQIDAAWAIGDDAGGLFTGTVANNTWYHVFIINGGGGVDAGFDTSIVAANRPAAYTEYRRIGSVKTGGTGNIIAFKQFGDYFLWSTAPLDINTTQGSPSTSRTMSTPLGLQLMGHFMVTLYFGGPQYLLVSSLSAADIACSVTEANVYGAGDVVVLTNTSSAVRTRGVNTGESLKMYTIGWHDPRGEY